MDTPLAAAAEVLAAIVDAGWTVTLERYTDRLGAVYLARVPDATGSSEMEARAPTLAGAIGALADVLARWYPDDDESPAP